MAAKPAEYFAERSRLLLVLLFDSFGQEPMVACSCPPFTLRRNRSSGMFVGWLFYAVDRQLLADFCLSLPTATSSSQSIMLLSVLDRSNANAWSSAVQSSGQYRCNQVVKWSAISQQLCRFALNAHATKLPVRRTGSQSVAKSAEVRTRGMNRPGHRKARYPSDF